jgi:hypothetical protein
MFLTGAVAAPLQSEMGLSDATFGLLMASFFGATALTSIPAGRLTDRLGWVPAIRLSAVGTALALLAVASSKGPTQLTLSLCLGGIAFGLSGPASNLAVSSGVRRRRGLAFGIKQAAVPLATLYSGLSLPLLVVVHGWRSAYLVGLLFPLAVLLLSSPARTTRRAARAPGPVPTADLVERRALRQLLVAVLAAAVTASALTSFLVLGLVDRGMGLAAAGTLVTVASAVGLVVRVGAGWLVDARPSLPPLNLAGRLLLAGALGFALLGVGPVAATALAAVLAYGAGWGWQGLVHYGMSTLGPGGTGRATGTVMVGASVGGVLGPSMFGGLVASAGFASAWIGVAIVALGAAVLLLRIPQRSRS